MALNFLHICIWASWIWSSAVEICEQSQSTHERSAPAPSLIQQTKQLQEFRGDFSGNPTSESQAEAPVSPEGAAPSKMAVSGTVCGFVGGALGGLVGVVTEILSAKNEVSIRAISVLVGGLFGAAAAGITHYQILPVAMFALGKDEESVTIYDETLFDKLEHLASSIVTVAGYEGQNSENLKEKKLYAQDKKEALNILNDLHKLEAESNPFLPHGRSPEDTRKGIEKDFHELEEVLSHGHTAEFETAEPAAENLAIITEQDISSIEAGREEDAGTENTTENLQGHGHVVSADMIEAENSTGKATLVQHTGQATRIAAGTPWKDAVVNYCIAPDVSNHVRHLWVAATASLTRALPCLQFVDVGHKKGTSYDAQEDQLCKKSPAIFLQSNVYEHCYAYVGMVDFYPSQTVQIKDPNCANLGIIEHELLHAMGMAHEQARVDRDSNVVIYWSNIKGGKQANFQIKENGYVHEDYDILSIMHYDNYAFAKDASQLTIEEIGATTHDLMGQRNGLATSDVQQLADMYKKENPQCEALAIDGMGCLDALDRNGNDMCSGITQCNSEAITYCCACGGGMKIQCYKGSPCPTVQPLPPPAGSDCIQDVTYHFGNYPCIYRNKCDFDVKWKCPSFECEHTARSKKATMTYCGSSVQTEICQPGKCQAWQA